jgi:hypothetical protein
MRAPALAEAGKNLRGCAQLVYTGPHAATASPASN